MWGEEEPSRRSAGQLRASRTCQPVRGIMLHPKPFWGNWWMRLVCLIYGHSWQYPWGPGRRRCAGCLRRERVARSGEWKVDRRPRVWWGSRPPHNERKQAKPRCGRVDLRPGQGLVCSHGRLKVEKASQRHWRSYGDAPLPTGEQALSKPFAAFPSWYLRLVCARCGQERMINEVHAPRRDLPLRTIIDRARHDGCGGRAGRAELLTGVAGASGRPVRRIVLDG